MIILKILQAGGTDDKRKNVIYADTLTLIFEGFNFLNIFCKNV